MQRLAEPLRSLPGRGRLRDHPVADEIAFGLQKIQGSFVEIEVGSMSYWPAVTVISVVLKVEG